MTILSELNKCVRMAHLFRNVDNHQLDGGSALDIKFLFHLALASCDGDMRRKASR